MELCEKRAIIYAKPANNLLEDEVRKQDQQLKDLNYEIENTAGFIALLQVIEEIYDMANPHSAIPDTFTRSKYIFGNINQIEPRLKELCNNIKSFELFSSLDDIVKFIYRNIVLDNDSKSNSLYDAILQIRILNIGLVMYQLGLFKKL